MKRPRRTTRDWSRDAAARRRYVHMPSGVTGNLVGHCREVGILFLRYDYCDGISLPVFERFPKSELEPEGETL